MAILKSRQAPVGHAAGIYADMTLDGPEIGTLVAVVDRAKNLPNRRTMGKQDPYCAMRLAKEAKKTGTDRRGGQTPRWDQELRFLVHDSPDYYKLKCSIFNDDKKTDLIGEAWIDLTQVIKSGGGQCDLWQQLNFKGKYAGDIRVELTYYDSREKPVEKRMTSDRAERMHAVGNSSSPASATGHRHLGPRDLRRRPLPANPVSQSTPPQMQQPPLLPPKALSNEDVHPHMQMHAPVPVRPYSQHDEYQDSNIEEEHTYYQENYEDETFDEHIEYYDQSLEHPEHSWQHDPDQDFRDYSQRSESYNSCPSLNSDPLEMESHVSMLSSSASLPQPVYPDEEELWGKSRPSFVHTHSEPSSPYSSPQAVRPMPSPTYSDGQIPHQRNQVRSSVSPTKAPVFRDSPLRQSMSHEEAAMEPQRGPTQQEVPPPPPPKHRDTPPRKQRSEYPPSSYMPQPLRLGGKRSSVNERSPLQAIEDSSNARRLEGMIQPQTPQRHSVYESSTIVSPQQQVDSYNQRRSSFGSEQGISKPQSEILRPSSQHDYESQNRSRSSIGYQGTEDALDTRRVAENQRVMQERGERRGPVSNRGSASPNPHGHLSNSSISNDGPYPPMDGRRLSGIPFGPDSYDVLNPGSSPVTNAGTLFETPEQARESTKLREAEKARDSGPIIGNDGREIDPSDHLPADTWAPEPERKNKKPEHVVHIRSRNNQSTPTSNRTSPVVIRHGGDSPYQNSHFGSSPQLSSPVTPSSRNRLQKPHPTRPLPVQPYTQTQPQNHYQSTTPPAPSQSNPGSATNVNQRPRRSSWRMDSPGNIVRPSPSEYQVPIGIGSSPHGVSPNHYQSSAPSTPSRGPNTYPPAPRQYEQRNSYYNGMQAPNVFDDPLAAEMSMIDIGPSRMSGGRTMARPYRAY